MKSSEIVSAVLERYARDLIRIQEGSYVFITGAAGGLGKAFAVECASRGWNLFLTDISDRLLAVLSNALSKAYGVDIVYKSCDLTEKDSRSGLFDYMKQSGIKYWMLINVAGIDYEGTFYERDEEQICSMLRLNVEANLVITRTIINFRDKHRTFRVINVSSLAAFYPMPVKAIYAASKRFLLDFSIALREEFRSQNATVTALCPAGMPTTKQCIKCIDAQGFMGELTTTNVGFVASHTIDHALKGRAVYVPGTLNRILRTVGSIPPATMIARLIGIRWGAAHKKSFEPDIQNI